MVLPFLTVYLTSSLGYSVKSAGIIMSVFGIGSMLGSYLGGRFTDKFGPYQVMMISLFAGGTSYFILPFITDFYLLACGVFMCAVLNESLRPGNSSMVAHFAKPETFTRSFSLLRMAVNLGVSIGPAVAGLLAGISYKLLFVGDGVTNIIAGIVFVYFFSNKKPSPHHKAKEKSERSQSPYRDVPYLFFVLLCMFYAISFFQIFNGIPLYYKDVYFKPEQAIGLLLGLNGLIVFIFEMVTVNTIENKWRPARLIVSGSIMLSVSFFLYTITHSNIILIISMILMSFSEIFAMPFMVSHAVKRSKPETRGSYIAAYTIVWSLALIISPSISTQIITHYNYETLWYVMSIFCLLTALGFAVVMKKQ